MRSTTARGFAPTIACISTAFWSHVWRPGMAGAAQSTRGSSAMTIGGIEAGGTHWTCAVGDGGKELERIESFPAGSPTKTIARAIEFFREVPDLKALGVGCFGPVDLRRSSPAWGTITTTPKPGWAQTDLVSTLDGALSVPIAFDTDVNAAAIGERRWGAARGLETFAYVTVGTGIGCGIIANGRPVHGLMHPEFGHVRVPHGFARDPFPGACPYHGDCLEGLASGRALEERWGSPGEKLSAPEVWELEAEYIALGLASIVLVLSPERIILGGGVSRATGLISRVRMRLCDLMGGYIELPQFQVGIDDYLVPPGLGARAGVHGAIELARLIT